ncbi:phage terminase small subunit [Thiothrix nivea]|uniref:Small terminase subunit n=1 Tax=Thiothrix nivea (strain ATCC 35100 / DSM 5205 / JP2) TaxID=870187 RepID=A0A656HFL8_THINJ|nr:phage terminase small subunit [Thiothrix nivea]EIJ35718.1 small terminase subunit [Thiothrix nivea DSM 5205]
MISPAAQHRVKVESGRNPAPDSQSADRTANGQYRAFLYKLKSDRKRLSSIRSQTRRVEVKREILTEYSDYLDGVLSADCGGQDSVVVWCALWAADVGNISRAVQLAGYALKHDMQQPDGFSRSLVESITEEISKAALAGNPADHLPDLQTLWALVAGQDMTDSIAAKLCKAYGMALAETDRNRAAELLEQAQALQSNIGVKGHLKKLQGVKPVTITTDTAKRYDLPTSRAAKLAGVSVPTFLKLASLNPAELPYVCFESGKHKAFRFCHRDVETFLQKRTHGAAA